MPERCGRPLPTPGKFGPRALLGGPAGAARAPFGRSGDTQGLGGEPGAEGRPAAAPPHHALARLLERAPALRAPSAVGGQALRSGFTGHRAPLS